MEKTKTKGGRMQGEDLPTTEKDDSLCCKEWDLMETD